jgi:hypothetical protein
MIDRLRRGLAQISLISWLWFVLALIAVVIAAYGLRYEPMNKDGVLVWDRWERQYCQAGLRGAPELDDRPMMCR